MSFAKPLVITVNAIAKNLNQISFDDYGSEYYLREATQEFRVRIRNSTESPQKDGTVFDRHNVELTQTVFATSTTPKIVRQVYIVFRNEPGDTVDDPSYLGAALSGLMVLARYQDLVSWLS